jgi:hypothetical protein
MGFNSCPDYYVNGVFRAGDADGVKKHRLNKTSHKGEASDQKLFIKFISTPLVYKPVQRVYDVCGLAEQIV